MCDEYFNSLVAVPGNEKMSCRKELGVIYLQFIGWESFTSTLLVGIHLLALYWLGVIYLHFIGWE